MKFRKLRAEEIDCRISTINEYGLTLLLYKDARVDQRILDETVGAENWQRSHELINGNLFCNVGIKVDRKDGFGEWVWKQDVGTESYTEKEKGQASDSFKRACFNWGIGRELYSTPTIRIKSDNCSIKHGNNGKLACYDRFEVETIEYNPDGNISILDIKNATRGETVFAYEACITEGEADALRDALEKGNVNIKKLLKQKKVNRLTDLRVGQCKRLLAQLEEAKNEADRDKGKTDR